MRITTIAHPTLRPISAPERSAELVVLARALLAGGYASTPRQALRTASRILAAADA